jgi:CheY-like chemotaxis protein
MTTTHPAGGQRVLVVEDFPDARNVILLLLSFSGFEARGAGDGAEGLQLALEWRPDAVVSDINMPGLNGWELARRVRNALGGGVRLIALTACADQADHQRSLDAGFDHHLIKPADPRLLLNLLRVTT